MDLEGSVLSQGPVLHALGQLWCLKHLRYEEETGLPQIGVWYGPNGQRGPKSGGPWSARPAPQSTGRLRMSAEGPHSCTRVDATWVLPWGNRGGVGATGPWTSRRTGGTRGQRCGGQRGAPGVWGKEGGPAPAPRARVPVGCCVHKWESPRMQAGGGSEGRGEEVVSTQGRGEAWGLEEHSREGRVCALRVTWASRLGGLGGQENGLEAQWWVRRRLSHLQAEGPSLHCGPSLSLRLGKPRCPPARRRSQGSGETGRLALCALQTLLPADTLPSASTAQGPSSDRSLPPCPLHLWLPSLWAGFHQPDPVEEEDGGLRNWDPDGPS